MSIKESRVIYLIYFSALIGLILYFVSMLGMQLLQLLPMKTPSFSIREIIHDAFEILLYVVSIIVVTYRLISIVKNNILVFKGEEISVTILRKTGIPLMFLGAALTFSFAFLILVPFDVGQRDFIKILGVLPSGLSVSILGIFMYELSRISICETKR